MFEHSFNAPITPKKKQSALTRIDALVPTQTNKEWPQQQTKKPAFLKGVLPAVCRAQTLYQNNLHLVRRFSEMSNNNDDDNNNNNNNSNAADDDNDPDDDEIVPGAPLGEGWVGMSRPAPKAVGPPVADRANRKKLYTTVAVKESERVERARARARCVRFDKLFFLRASFARCSLACLRAAAAATVDTQTFSETVKSNRVWWTPEDDQLPDADEAPFDVDVSDNALAKKYKVGETVRR